MGKNSSFFQLSRDDFTRKSRVAGFPEGSALVDFAGIQYNAIRAQLAFYRLNQSPQTFTLLEPGCSMGTSMVKTSPKMKTATCLPSTLGALLDDRLFSCLLDPPLISFWVFRSQIFHDIHTPTYYQSGRRITGWNLHMSIAEIPRIEG